MELFLALAIALTQPGARGARGLERAVTPLAPGSTF